MKTTALIAMLMLSLTTALKSENIYQIFRVTQGVTVYTSSKPETTATKRMEVKLSDMLNIPSGGEVAILETSTKQIYSYSSNEASKVKVAKLLIDAKKQANKNIAAVNKELSYNIEKIEQKGYSYIISGATYRGAGTDSITHAVYSALCSAIAQQETASTISLELEHNGETFHFKASNSGNAPVFFNIIRLGETPHICIPAEGSKGIPCLIMDANSTWSTEQIQFVYEDGDNYIIFATDVPFNSQLLQQMFNKKQEASAQAGCTVTIAHAVKK